MSEIEPLEPNSGQVTAEEIRIRAERRLQESGETLPAEVILEFRDADRHG